MILFVVREFLRKIECYFKKGGFMDKLVWFGNQKNIKTTIKVVLLPELIKISNFCINKYFKNYIGVRLAYLGDQEQLFIKPANEDYYRLWSKNDPNFKYLAVKKFISMYCFIIDKKEHLNYTYSWDNHNKYLIVNNVCAEKERRI